MDPCNSTARNIGFLMDPGDRPGSGGRGSASLCPHPALPAADARGLVNKDAYCVSALTGMSAYPICLPQKLPQGA